MIYSAGIWGATAGWRREGPFFPKSLSDWFSPFFDSKVGCEREMSEEP
jgi:hypothetical protein